MQPTLIIGLGGTGTGVVEMVRDRLLLHNGETDPKNLRCLYVDSDIQHNTSLQKHMGRAFGLTVGGDVADYATPGSDRRRRLQLDDWFDNDRLSTMNTQSFTQGVGGVRMYGRLLFLDSIQLGSLMSQVVMDLQELARLNQGTPQLFVVASAGGGTGSGTFIDMGYLSAHLLATQLSGTTIKREGVVALHAPNIQGAEPQMRQNTAAMLTELDHFSDNKRIFTANYNSEPLSTDIGRGAPYDYITLVSPTQGPDPLSTDCDSALSLLKSKMADYLFLRVIEGTDKAVGNNPLASTPGATQGAPGARIQDTAQNYADGKTDALGYPVRFQTFGVSLRQFPVGLEQARAQRAATALLIERWLGRAAAGQIYLDRSTEIDNDTTRRDHFSKDMDTLRQMLGIPPAYKQGDDRQRDSESDAIFDRLIRPRDGNSESLVTALSQSASTPHLLDNQFRYSIGAPVQAGGEGYIAGTIYKNYQELRDTALSSSLPRQFAQTVRTIALDRNRGPRWTLLLLHDLTEGLATEIGMLDQIATAELPGEPASTVPVTPPAKGGTSGGPTQEQAARANARFEKEIVTKKRDLLQTIRDNVFAIERQRIEQLVRYLEEWRRSIIGDTEETEAGRSLPYGTIQTTNVATDISRNALTTTAFSERDLEPLAAVLATDTFPQNLPRKQGGVDWDPFAPLLQRLNDSTRKAALTTVRQPVHHYLNIVAEQQGHTIDQVAQDMVRESRPLLQMNLGMNGYGDMLPGFPKWTACWWLLSDPDSQDELFQQWLRAAHRAANVEAQAMQVQPGNVLVQFPVGSPHLLALLFMRTTFPTRILNQYAPADRIEQLKQARATAFRTIRPPLPPERRDRAATLLLVGEVLSTGPVTPQANTTSAPNTPPPLGPPSGNTQYRNASQNEVAPRFVPEKDGAGRITHRFMWTQGFNEQHRILLPNRYDDAVYELAMNEDAMDALARQIQERAIAPAQRGLMQHIVTSHLQSMTRLSQESPSAYGDTEVRTAVRELGLEDVPIRQSIQRLREWGTRVLQLQEMG